MICRPDRNQLNTFGAIFKAYLEIILDNLVKDPLASRRNSDTSSFFPTGQYDRLMPTNCSDSRPHLIIAPKVSRVCRRRRESLSCSLLPEGCWGEIGKRHESEMSGLGF